MKPCKNLLYVRTIFDLLESGQHVLAGMNVWVDEETKQGELLLTTMLSTWSFRQYAAHWL